MRKGGMEGEEGRREGGREFRDCHTSIAFTPVGPQPNLAHIFGWIWDRFEPIIC